MSKRLRALSIHSKSLKSLNEISTWTRCCVITIVNDTSYNFTTGQSAMTSGEVHRRVPETIPRHEYNTILSRKASFSVKGCVGMVSYEVSSFKSDDHILQIAWHVPLRRGVHDVYFNVDFGRKMASKSEVNRLLYEIPPEMRRRAAEYTPGTFDLGNFTFEVAMTDAEQSLLTIRISEIKKGNDLKLSECDDLKCDCASAHGTRY